MHSVHSEGLFIFWPESGAHGAAEHKRIFPCDVKYFFLCVFLRAVCFEKGNGKLLHVKTCHLSGAKDKVMLYGCLDFAVLLS